jgi:hypothetical protein
MFINVEEEIAQKSNVGFVFFIIFTFGLGRTCAILKAFIF